VWCSVIYRLQALLSSKKSGSAGEEYLHHVMSSLLAVTGRDVQGVDGETGSVSEVVLFTVSFWSVEFTISSPALPLPSIGSFNAVSEEEKLFIAVGSFDSVAPKGSIRPTFSICVRQNRCWNNFALARLLSAFPESHLLFSEACMRLRVDRELETKSDCWTERTQRTGLVVLTL